MVLLERAVIYEYRAISLIPFSLWRVKNSTVRILAGKTENRPSEGQEKMFKKLKEYTEYWETVKVPPQQLVQIIPNMIAPFHFTCWGIVTVERRWMYLQVGNRLSDMKWFWKQFLALGEIFFYRKISKICRYSNMKGVIKVQFTSVNSYNCEQFCFI